MKTLKDMFSLEELDNTIPRIKEVYKNYLSTQHKAIVELHSRKSKVPLDVLYKHVTMVNPDEELEPQFEAYDENKAVLLKFLEDNPEELVEINTPLYRYHPENEVDVCWTTDIWFVTSMMRFSLHVVNPFASNDLMVIDEPIMGWPVPLYTDKDTGKEVTEYEVIIPSLYK